MVVPSVAALYVAKDSIYKTMPECDCYDLDRNAMTYNGTLPVVAHPPCQLWGKMAKINHKRWGGDHNKPGNDGGCFASAVEAVNRWGGVLEHPAMTRAWAAHNLTAPASIGWQRSIFGGWVCEVWQSAYGHRANKATWLYYNGENPPHQLRWERPVGTHQVGGRFGTDSAKPTLKKREANATPPEFRDELLRLALLANDLISHGEDGPKIKL
jgi:hypothetical protein